MIVSSGRKANSMSSDQIIIKKPSAIHSGRNSIMDLADIGDTLPRNNFYVPRKSLRSKLISDAMHIRDHTKIQ